MTIGISSWNPMLSPSYSNWSAIANRASALSCTGLSAESLNSMNTAQTDSALLGSTPSEGTYDALSISPNAYQLLYNADNVVANNTTGGSVSPQSFFAQAQQYTNPLFQSSSSSTTSLLMGVQNSLLENSAPSYYMNTFNPYGYLGQTSSSSFNSLA